MKLILNLLLLFTFTSCLEESDELSYATYADAGGTVFTVVEEFDVTANGNYGPGGLGGAWFMPFSGCFNWYAESIEETSFGPATLDSLPTSTTIVQTQNEAFNRDPQQANQFASVQIAVSASGAPFKMRVVLRVGLCN
jgi:hypothetical protein